MSFVYQLYFKKTKGDFTFFWNKCLKTLESKCPTFLKYFAEYYILNDFNRPDTWAFYTIGKEDPRELFSLLLKCLFCGFLPNISK